MEWFKDWWLDNWRTLLGSGGVVAIVIPIVVVLVSKHKKNSATVAGIHPDEPKKSYEQAKICYHQHNYRKAAELSKKSAGEI